MTQASKIIQKYRVNHLPPNIFPFFFFFSHRIVIDYKNYVMFFFFT